MSAENPRGAGRKPSPPELKKIPVGVKLPRWLVEWMRVQQESQAVLIEEALKARHKLKPPEGACRACGDGAQAASDAAQLAQRRAGAVCGRGSWRGRD